MNKEDTNRPHSGEDSYPLNDRPKNAEKSPKASDIDLARQDLDKGEIFEKALFILKAKFSKTGLESGNGAQRADNANEKATGIQIGSDGKTETIQDFIPARMINEYIYCPRLFYYEYVEGVFLDNADTLRGSAIHERVDCGNGAMPQPSEAGKTTKDENTQTDSNACGAKNQPETIHARSVMLFSERLGVNAKIDLVEITTEEKDGVEGYLVCPVDYKAGSPRKEDDGNAIWEADKIQLGLQALLLRENGYRCNEGIIYYRETRQRVHLKITEELEKWIIEQVEKARLTAAGNIPPPLKNSPKCVRCSLAPICLPDETILLKQEFQRQNTLCEIPENQGIFRKNKRIRFNEVRRLVAAREDTRALYLTTQGLKISRSDETLEIKENQKTIETVRINDICHVSIFGNIQITTQAIQALCYAEVPITYFSMGGWFYGITRGHSLKNVFVRIRQFKIASEEEESLKYASRFVFGKVRNQRTMLMRNHIDTPEECVRKMKQLSEMALRAKTMQELLGIEGMAANLYFENFAGMIKTNDELDLAGNGSNTQSEQDKAKENELNFDFRTRNKRPPTDPVNATLSLAYSLLAKDCAIAAMSVGFDPYIGFYHKPRFGKPALALDLMEEFRPIIAESVVITAINNRVLNTKDFIRAGKNVNLTANGRKKFFYVYEQRMNTIFTHPIFDYKITYRRALEIQARLLAKAITHEIPDYVPIIVR
ncbi:MAG: CRISPR-associated endonuclease Cas4g/Cas1g [Verrucomicrobiia bacterium]|jgi:CRISPR-associated protein Cas1